MAFFVRLFQPLGLIYPEGDMPHPTVSVGWLRAGDQRRLFVVCEACADCDNEGIKTKIYDRISERAPVAAE